MKIQELILFTNNLDQQVDFYATILEFPIINSTPETCSFKMGNSILTLKYKRNIVPYHYAINIPSFKRDISSSIASGPSHCISILRPITRESNLNALAR